MKKKKKKKEKKKEREEVSVRRQAVSVSNAVLLSQRGGVQSSERIVLQEGKATHDRG